jgi:ATP-dependent Clp protease ATP-binding subunit ClpB
MTSNIASPIIQDLTSSGVGEEAVRVRVMEELRNYFRPEFLNRVDDVIVFQPLAREQIGHIAEIQLGRLRKLLADRKITLELTDAARNKLAEEGYDPIFGARPLKRVIQQRLQNPLALKLLQGEFREGDTVVVDADPVTNEFTFTKAVVAEPVAA